MGDAQENMKILVVGPIPPPAGGMANQTRQLCKLLTGDGHDVTLVAVNAPYRPLWVGRVPVLRAFFRLLPYCWALFRQIGKADVVHLMANSGWSWHLFATPAIWLAWLLRKPLLINYRGGHAETFFQKSFYIVERSLNRATGIIVPSAYLQEVFAKWGKHVDIVPNVLNEQRFFPSEGEYRGIEASQHLNLIVTRNLEQIYDVPCAIRCLAMLKKDYPQARLSVAGSGPEWQALEALVEELGLTESVTFLGRLDADKIADLYRSADVMLNPSTVDNSPNSVIEALACGVPVVTTNVGGIPKLVRHEFDALMIEPRQPELMCAQVKRLIEQPELAKQLVSNGFSTVQKFLWGNVSLKLKDNYTRAINAKGLS